MAEKMHTAERFCREVIARKPGAIEDANFFRSKKADFGEKWPDWCDLTMASVYAILTDGAENAAPILARLGANALPEMTAALIWMRYKTVLAFDPELSDVLQNQPLEGVIPGQVLERLPYPCVYVERTNAVSFFAWLEWDVKLEMQELRILIPLDNGRTISIPVPLVGTLEDSRNALITSGLLRAWSLPAGATNDVRISGDSADDSTITGCINHLLYLCSDKPDIPDATNIKARRTYDFTGAAKRTASVSVGTRIGAALKKARAGVGADVDYSKERDAKTSNSPVPHIRRAHWHHYWIGPKTGERKLLLKWLPPIPVNMDDADAQSVVRTVKPDTPPSE